MLGHVPRVLRPLPGSGHEYGFFDRIANLDQRPDESSSAGFIGRRVFGATAKGVMRAAGRPVLAVPERTYRIVGSPSDADPPAVAA